MDGGFILELLSGDQFIFRSDENGLDAAKHLGEWLRQPVHFSRQGEEAPDEAATYPHPIFDEVDGRLFSKWNRNRVTSAQKIDGVPKIVPEQREALAESRRRAWETRRRNAQAHHGD